MTETRSEIFDARRWGKLVSRHWMENRKKYILFMVAYAGILTLWYAYLTLLNDRFILGTEIQFPAYTLGLYITGCLYAATLFGDLASRRTAINFLALPASRLEKALCAFLFGVPVFFIAYTTVFYCVDIPMVMFSNHMQELHPVYVAHSSVPIALGSLYNVFTAENGPLPEKAYHLFLLGFFSAQAVFALGTIYFKRYSLIQSILAILVLLSVGAIAHERIINAFLPHGWHTNMLSWVRYNEDDRASDTVFLPTGMRWFTMALLQYGLPLFIWIITYFRLKEKEI